ncbi:MAG: pyridoxal phosphate-dependent aminotransferase [Rhodospirillaceae bacterium]|nr:pyridoxal phosphate-dependent aminotransferase [Rhodospirillaceae bacterium]
MRPSLRPDELLGSLRPSIAALPDSGIVEVVQYGMERPGLIPLWVGEGDATTPSSIGDAAVAALRAGQTFYTYQRGIPPLRQAMARYLSGVHDREIAPERIFITASGMQAITLTLQALIDPGDEVVLVTPVWPNILAALNILGGVVRAVPMTLTDRGWSVDFDRLADACGPKTRAVFVNSPNNPTGWIMPREEMEALADLARHHGFWIIADEVYNRITYDTDHAPSFLEVMEADERIVVVNSFSKNWAMTGWRVGWVVASPALGQVYENLIQYNTSGVATFLQYGAVAALEEGLGTIDAVRETCRIGRDIVCQRLGAMRKVRLARPQGAFYAFLAVDGETDSRSLAFRLVDEANVGLAPGSAFGPGGEGFLRLCFACSPARLSEAMDRMEPMLS